MPNCKQGDIAIVIRGPSVGAMVHVEGPYTGGSAFKRWLGLEDLIWQCETLSPAFNARRRIDGAFVDLRPGDSVLSPDKLLRPLRDRPGDDEMLRIVGRPAEEVKPREPRLEPHAAT